MLKKIRHSLRCFPRHRCDCDDDSQCSGDQANHRRARVPKRALRQPLPKNAAKSAAPANQPQANSEGEDGSEDEDSSGDYDPQAPPPSYVPVSTKGSHTGVTPAMSETNLDESSSSDDPYSPSTRNPYTNSPGVSDTGSHKPSSGDDFYSVGTKNSHTGISLEMSDPNLSESQYESFSDSEESSSPLRASGISDNNTDGDDYNGADDESLDLDQDDEILDLDEVIYDAEYSSGWSSTSSDRRRRRSLDSQAQADAEHRGLYGSRGSSGSSKRQRLDDSSDTASGRVGTGIELTVEDVTRYRNKGAQYQAWIEDPEEPGCQIQPATLTIEEMIDKKQQVPWKVHESYFIAEPMALQGGDVESMNIDRGGPRYRYTHLRQDPGPNTLEANEFEHRVTRGIMIAERLYREDGPHWNEVARAQYLLDFNLNTLRYVVFTDIGNEETGPYIRHELYPRLGVRWSQARDVECMKFEHGSAEYQELLGTKLGKAMACLILSSFPRGTMKITRIATWCNSTAPQMRFEIEPVIAA
ncbi:hypothetical protein CBS147332_2627 [Penicillium roqueforti]|nr:hypothetical protein CBS147332_2627 [Penicillium roqueforti]KAI3099754.1 hypothetical protein CBS147331_8456 [Penicillium roqueforti]